MSDKMLDRLAKILNQAENAATEEEAAVFMSKAQSLATTHAIDLAVARQHTAKKEQREQPTSEQINIGQRGAKGNKRLINLFSAVARNNDVRLNIAHNSTYVVAFGMPSDIEVVQALYASLALQMVTAGNEFIASGEYKSEVVGRVVKRKVGEYYDSWEGRYKNRYEEEYVTKPVDGRVARASFYEAFTTRISARLRKARQEALEAVQDAQVTVYDDTTGAEVQTTGALVLKSKEVEVSDYYKRTSTARGSWKGARSSARSSSGYQAGTQAGNSARLGGSKAIGGSRTAIR